MTEAAILLAFAGMLIVTGACVWRQATGPARGASRRVARGLVLAFAATALVGLGAYRLMNARGFQVAGEILSRVETSRPLVALTFDDGPKAPFTDEILRLLAERGAKATFFVIGERLEESPDLARQITAAGHELGNHTYSHPRMVFEPYAFVRSELERTDERIRAAGYTGAIHFRSPYAKKLFLLPLYLWRAGKKNILADVEPDADVAATSQSMVAHVLAHVRPGSIVILHAENAVRAESLAALPGILDGLKERGYTIVTVSELLAAEDAASLERIAGVAPRRH